MSNQLINIKVLNDSQHKNGHVRIHGAYSNTFRASSPAWTHNAMVERKTEKSPRLYVNGVNTRWPLDFVRDKLLTYLNPNEWESICSIEESNGDVLGFDNLANGVDASRTYASIISYFHRRMRFGSQPYEFDLMMLYPSLSNDYDRYIHYGAGSVLAYSYEARWRFCQTTYPKGGSVKLLDDSSANNGRYAYYTDYLNNNSEYGQSPSPFVFDETEMSTRFGNDRVKNLTMQIFVKITREDAGAIVRNGWYSTVVEKLGYCNTSTNLECWSNGWNIADGWSVGVAAGDGADTDSDGSGNNNIYATGNGKRLVVRYANVRNFTSDLELTVNQWHMVTLVINDDFSPTLYIDDGGTGKSWTGASNYIPSYPNTWFTIANNVGDVWVNPATSSLVEHSIQMGQGITLTYAKALSQSEVEQNWNAFKGFYGL